MSKRTVAAAVALGAAALGHVARSWFPVPRELRHRSLLVPHSVVGPLSLAYARRFLSLPGPPQQGIEVTAIEVRGEDGTTVSVLRHEPPLRTTGRGALLWLHGGGYVAGTAAAEIPYCSRVATELGIPVFSPAYRLAPEHPFPAGLDDAHTTLLWIRANAPDLGVHPDRIAVGGTSAGGGLAAALCQLARDRGEVRPCFQLLRYPMLDDRTRRGRGWRRFTWTPASNRYAWRSYLGKRADVPPYAVPSRTRDLSDLPPAWIGVGDADLFYDEDRRYASALHEAGVPVVLHVEPRMYHGADGMAPEAASMQAFLAREIAALEAGLGR